jgi:hypothetical protein
MSRRHRQRSSAGNLTIPTIISPDVMLSRLILGQRNLMLFLGVLTLAALTLLLSFCGQAAGPSSSSSYSSTSDPVQAAPAPPIVIGFLGGLVRRDDAVHSTVILAHNLQKDYAAAVHVETFENRRLDDAHSLILHLLGPDHEGQPTEAEKRAARIILYGHSWGASAVVALARNLQRDGIPVLLTVQVDSISRSGQNDAVIPENVARAVNYYQDAGVLHGRPAIRAADATRTQILGNFRMDYSRKPISCPNYPWYDRIFMRSHIEIECDPAVWQHIEELIRLQLPSSLAGQTSTP